LNQLLTGLFTAETAGQRKDQEEISTDNPKTKNPEEIRGFLLNKLAGNKYLNKGG